MLVVVVRYFGGIKLGIPGLIRAYKSSTADALSNARIIEKTAGKHFLVQFDYLSMNPVMKVLKDLGIAPQDPVYGESCSLRSRVRLSAIDSFRERLKDIAEIQETI